MVLSFPFWKSTEIKECRTSAAHCLKVASEARPQASGLNNDHATVESMGYVLRVMWYDLVTSGSAGCRLLRGALTVLR